MNQQNDVSAVLQQYAAETGVRSVQKVEQDFEAVVQQVPAEHVTTGLAEAMHSEHTPPFEDMVGESFERGDDEQRAGIVRQLVDAAGPVALQPLVERGALPYPHDGTVSAAALVDADVVRRLDPELVRQIARDAVQDDPAVIDRMSEFFAVHPTAGRTLGGAALSVALGKIAEAR